MIQLHPHNQEAFDSLHNILIVNNERKSCIIHATGTGKSLIISKMIETYSNDIHLFFAPSSMIFYEINKHISNNNIIFRTYQHYLNKDFNDIKKFDVKFIYLDEFHRIGAKEWGDIIIKVMNIFPNAKIIGASATHIRFLDDNRNMAKEIFDDNIASMLSLNDSISQKIHRKPLYVSTFFNTNEILTNTLRKIKKNSEPSQYKSISENIKKKFETFNIKNSAENILRKYITEERKKILVFFSNSDEFNVYKDIFKEVLKKVFKENINVDYIHSKFSDNVNQKKLNTFSIESKPQVLFSVNMANEGLHIKGVDTVVLFRKTTSPIIYFQQIGRCFSVGQKIQPLIIDFVDNVTKITLLDYFKVPKSSNIIKNKTKNYLEKSNFHQKFFGEDFDLNIDLKDHTVELTSFLEQFNNSSNLWDKNIVLLKSYLEENNNKIPQAETPLGIWIRGVKTNIRTGQIIEEKKLLILQLIPNLIENQYDLQWENNYKILLKNYVIGKNINTYTKEMVNFITKNKRLNYDNKIIPERKKLLLKLDPDFFDRKIQKPVFKDDWNGQFLRLTKEYPDFSEITKIFVRKQQKNVNELSKEKKEMLSKFIDLEGFGISKKIREKKLVFDLIVKKGLPYMELDDQNYKYLKLICLHYKNQNKTLSDKSKEHVKEHIIRFQKEENLYGDKGRLLYFNIKIIKKFLLEEKRYPNWNESYNGLVISTFVKKWYKSTDKRRILFDGILEEYMLLKKDI